MLVYGKEVYSSFSFLFLWRSTREVRCLNGRALEQHYIEVVLLKVTVK